MRSTYLILSLVALLLIACDTGSQSESNTNDSATEVRDSDSGSSTAPKDTSVDTMSSSENDSDSLTRAHQCDGESVDCYTECWQCAQENACQNEIAACAADTGCTAFLNCTETQCCDPNNSECDTGREWEACTENCRNTHNVTESSHSLYHQIQLCIACDICAISCSQNEADHFAMCADATPWPSEPLCYARDGEPDQVACFTWAGDGGPCTAAKETCHNSDGCATLETCISDSYLNDNWQSIQEMCFTTAGEDAEAVYWAYMQCIYCDACDIACAADAINYNCSTYTPQD